MQLRNILVGAFLGAVLLAPAARAATNQQMEAICPNALYAPRLNATGNCPSESQGGGTNWFGPTLQIEGNGYPYSCVATMTYSALPSVSVVKGVTNLVPFQATSETDWDACGTIVLGNVSVEQSTGTRAVWSFTPASPCSVVGGVTTCLAEVAGKGYFSPTNNDLVTFTSSGLGHVTFTAVGTITNPATKITVDTGTQTSFSFN